MKIDYHECGDYLLPNIEVDKKDIQPIGKYGMMRLKYLKAHKKGTYNLMKMAGELIPYLVDVDRDAREMVETIIRDMAKAENVNEELKEKDMMKWVGMMNNFKSVAEEIVLGDVIYG